MICNSAAPSPPQQCYACSVLFFIFFLNLGGCIVEQQQGEIFRRWWERWPCSLGVWPVVGRQEWQGGQQQWLRLSESLEGGEKTEEGFISFKGLNCPFI